MNFAQRQADPRRHLVGMTIVVLFHALVVYALVTGLAKRVVEVIRAPIETKVIEEIKKPPPPPVVAAAPAPAAPAVVSAGVVCSNFQTVMGDVAYPRDAQRQGIEKGEALIQFTLSPTGEVKNITVISASHQIFARNSVRIVGEYKCQGQGREVTVRVPFGYKLQ